MKQKQRLFLFSLLYLSQFYLSEKRDTSMIGLFTDKIPLSNNFKTSLARHNLKIKEVGIFLNITKNSRKERNKKWRNWNNGPLQTRPWMTAVLANKKWQKTMKIIILLCVLLWTWALILDSHNYPTSYSHYTLLNRYNKVMMRPRRPHPSFLMIIMMNLWYNNNA